MTHVCHAFGCRTPVEPRLLMCAKHWKLVPYGLRAEIRATYRIGQETDKKPSAEYLTAMRHSIRAVAKAEGRTLISTFLTEGLKAQHPANPDFPKGVEVDARTERGAPACTLELPYPAPAIGSHFVECAYCGVTAAVTAAGRADDPRTVTLTCKQKQRLAS